MVLNTEALQEAGAGRKQGDAGRLTSVPAVTGAGLGR